MHLLYTPASCTLLPTFAPSPLPTLASGLFLATSCRKNNEVAAPDDVVSAQDAALSDEENAATTNLVDAAAPQDAAAAISPIVDAATLTNLLAPCVTHTSTDRRFNGLNGFRGYAPAGLARW